MAHETEQNQILNLFGKGKKKVYTDGLLFSKIYYTSRGLITSSTKLPNGFKVRCNGYIDSNDIRSNFDMLFILKDGTIIFTTETCIYCCENVGSFVKYIDENLRIIKPICEDSKVGLILEMTKSLRKHKSFSGKTRIFGNNTIYEMIDEDKQVYKIKHNKITVIFTKTGSIHVYLQ